MKELGLAVIASVSPPGGQSTLPFLGQGSSEAGSRVGVGEKPPTTPIFRVRPFFEGSEFGLGIHILLLSLNVFLHG